MIFGSGVIGAFGFGNPARLLGGKASDGGVDGNEPLGFIVSRAELSEQETSKWEVVQRAWAPEQWLGVRGRG